MRSPDESSEILGRFDGDLEVAVVVIDAFLEGSPRLMSGIRDAVARGDGRALRSAAHAMKGSIGDFSDAGHELVAGLESAAAAAKMTASETTCRALEAERGRLTPLLAPIRRDLGASPSP